MRPNPNPVVQATAAIDPTDARAVAVGVRDQAQTLCARQAVHLAHRDPGAEVADSFPRIDAARGAQSERVDADIRRRPHAVPRMS